MALFQIELVKLEIDENGSLDKEQTHNYLSLALEYPKEGVISVETIKELKLEDKTTYNFKNKSFADRIVFKQTIQGESLLNVKLTVKEDTNKIDKLIKGLFKEGLLAAAGFITGGIGMTILAAASKSTIKSVFDSSKEGKPNLLAQGKLPINANQKDDECRITLDTKTKIVLKKYKKSKSQVKITKKTMQPNESIGHLTLRITRLESNLNIKSNDSRYVV